MYRCQQKCSLNSYSYLTWDYEPDECPRCGGKIVKINNKGELDKLGKKGKLYFHNRWTAQKMQVGLDEVYCPTRQSYLDACKHGRVIHAGTREITTREIDPVGAKD